MKKRLVLILNGKGGVGKSFFAVNFIQYLKDRPFPHVAFDSDNENSTLKRFHPEAGFLNSPDFSSAFQKAIADWRKRHAIREDDVILLCLELFQIHQKHSDELRHRDLPSFNEFRETIKKLQTTAGIVQKESMTLIEELRRYQGGKKLLAPSVAGLVLTALFATLTGILIGRYLL